MRVVGTSEGGSMTRAELLIEAKAWRLFAHWCLADDAYDGLREIDAVLNRLYGTAIVDAMNARQERHEEIAAAFLVVEAMRGKGWHWRAVASCVAGERYRVGFSVVGCVGDWDRAPEHEAAADTLPLAICLAALKAIDAEQPSAQGAVGPLSSSHTADGK